MATRRAFGALAALAAFAPAAAASASPRRRLLARDDFRHGLGQWFVELEKGGSVTAARGTLEVDVPAGATIWFRERLEGPYVLEYTATPVSAGGLNDRVADLNNFWNAVDVRSPGDIFATPRGGALAEYDYLKTYYSGFGANYNTTTRLRRYVGEAGVRPHIHDYTEPLLVPNEPHRVRIVSDGSTVQWWNNGRLVFDHTDPEPYTGGHFAFRTTWSHFLFSGSRVWRSLPQQR
ncbi:DUF6250 domain-containing protein [Streptomyces cupreus]|uniref:Tat pathway signal sequence domain protein n=1 Tax=Streptomyces cupreus TaxID=2759956 RepID=A0A7X1IY22_9ACTN|nr:DUF6250 domain-containing protein [Streptomyces cupreus]MBC2900509.1 Tat pathway signal sequence domain protein [Streptomyces cupreus]